MEHPHLWTAISSDIVESSAGGYPRHSELRNAAENAITESQQTCPVPNPWIRESRGDGEVILAPADVPAAWLLDDFLHRLRIAILRYNRNKHEDHTLRLRVGIDFGDVVTEPGHVVQGGDPIVAATRLQESGAAREATVALPDAPIVTMISDGMYQRVVPHAAAGLEPRMFRRVRAVVPGKAYDRFAWLHVPGHQPPHVTGTEPDPDDGDPSDTQRPAPGNQGGGTPSARGAASRGITARDIGLLSVGDRNKFQFGNTTFNRVRDE
ncbi:hypothetical protein ABT336_08985 [Micromonospora sp. NPDC000207]|uniref:hypothetical protein n=1 Tax=Micromonospora sp. NPDC000207 TaxID=3154246 RepID=UPI0033206132